MRFSLASLLAMGWSPSRGEKEQCPRRRSALWHQQWPNRCFLFFLAQVIQDAVDDVLVLDTRDDSGRSTAAGADLDVYIEHALEPLRPGHCCMTLGGCA